MASSTRPTVPRLLVFLWLVLPLALRRLSRAVSVALTDGMYLVGFPKTATTLSIAALAAGFVVGWLHLGFDVVFSESMVLMVVVAVLGTMSAHLGILFVAWYAVGDLLLGHIGQRLPSGVGLGNALVVASLPQLIEYALLAMLAVGVPLAARGLVVTLPLAGKKTTPARTFTAALIATAVVSMVLVYVWAQTVPILMRPLFTWRGSLPSVAMAAPLQERVWLLVVATGLAAVARLYVQNVATAARPVAERVVRFQYILAAAKPVARRLLPPWVGAALGAAGLTFVLSGRFSSWAEALIVGAVLLVASATQKGLIPIRLGRWTEAVERVPLLARLAAGAVVISLVGYPILRSQLSASEGFRPLVILVVLSVVVFFLLNPGDARRSPSRART